MGEPVVLVGWVHLVLTLGTEVGWVYAPVGDPGGWYGDFSSEPIAGPWHRYSYSPW